MKKKKGVYIFFDVFRWLEIKKKKFIIKINNNEKKGNEKKKCWCRNWNGLLPNCIA